MGLDGDKGIDDRLSFIRILECEAINIVGDVLEQLGEKEDLKELVECDEAQGEEIILGRLHCWWRAIGESPMSGFIDVVKCLGRVDDIGEPIGQGQLAVCECGERRIAGAGLVGAGY